MKTPSHKPKQRLDAAIFRAAANEMTAIEFCPDTEAWCWRHIGACPALSEACRNKTPSFDYKEMLREWFAADVEEKWWFWWSADPMNDDARSARILALELAALIVEDGGKI